MRTIDWIGKQWYAYAFSAALILAGVIGVVVVGFNYGIDFAGGTEFVIRSAVPLSVAEVRDVVGSLGMGNAVIQKYGTPEERLFLIRLEAGPEEKAGGQGAAAAVGQRIHEALNQAHPPEGAGPDLVDLNLVREVDLAQLLPAAGVAPEQAGPLAGTFVQARRQKGGLFATWGDVATALGLPAASVEPLKAKAYLGNFVTLRTEQVGPTVGKELARSAIYAILWSLAGVMVYIRLRFREWRFSVAAIACLVHDVLTTAAVLVLTRRQFDIQIVAALLTIIGYSVNDTIVIFDRVRENFRLMRRDDQVTIFNVSISQCMSRTILTSLTVMLVVVAMLVVGGPVLRGFAIAMFVGVITGSYSTIFIASPLAIYWHRWTRGDQQAVPAV